MLAAISLPSCQDSPPYTDRLSAPDAPLLGPAQTAWLRRPLSFIVGSCDARHRPHLKRAIAAWLSDDGRRLHLLVPELNSGAVLADLRANGCIPVVCSEPSSHRTLQLKGRGVHMEAAAAEDLARAAGHLAGFTEEIGQFGFPPRVAQGLLAPEAPMLRLEFEIEAAFDQTPGPTAGEPLVAASSSTWTPCAPAWRAPFPGCWPPAAPTACPM